MLASFLAILAFGSYTRYTTIRGVITGVRDEVVLAAVPRPKLRVGQYLRVEVQAAGGASENADARITSITQSPASSRFPYRIGLDIPRVFLRRHGWRFLVRIPLERRHVYEWLLPCRFK